MTMQKTKVLELGYFIDEMEASPMRNYQALVRTIDDGVILPSQWVTVDEDGEPVGMADAVLGCAEYASFVEIPEDCAQWDTGSYGLGFTQEFLENQGVEFVEYIVLGEDIPWINPADWLEERVVALHEEEPATLEYIRGHARKIMHTLKNDPEKQAMLREWVMGRVSDMRTYYEVVYPDTEGLLEWRGTQPIHFTLADVQTVYVASVEEVGHFRAMYPQYNGTFVVLEAGE